MAERTVHLTFITAEVQQQMRSPKRAPGRVFYVDPPAEGDATLCHGMEPGDLLVTHLDCEHVTCLRCSIEAQKRWW